MKTPEFTPAIERILQLSIIEAVNRGSDFVGVDHLMAGIIMEGNNFGYLVLSDSGITLERIRHQSIRNENQPTPSKTT